MGSEIASRQLVNCICSSTDRRIQPNRRLGCMRGRGLRLPTLAYRRLRGDMIELYKILTWKYDVSVSSSFVTLRDNDSDTKRT